MMVRHASLHAAGLLLAAACSFNPTGAVTTDGAVLDTGPIPDSSIDGAGPETDAGPCPEPLLLSMTIGGVTDGPTTSEPFVHALVGDVIELSAAGSCTRQGTLTYQWQISPLDGTRMTALPDLASETITIYPTQAQDYVISLTISNGTGSRDRTVHGMTVYGWVQRDGLPGSQEIRDLAASNDMLWIAHKDGAHGLALDSNPVTDVFVAVNELSGGEVLGTNLRAVHYSTDGNLVWFGQSAARADVWRVDLNQSPFAVTVVPFDPSQALGETATVLDIGPAEPGVALATDKGLTISADTFTFAGDFAPADMSQVHAVTAGRGRRWAGGRKLYDLDNGWLELDAFLDPADMDNKIRALAVDDGRDELWVGSDDGGVARVTSAGEFAVKGIYGTAKGNLGTDKIRAFAVERTGPYAGDVWAATGAGVARYIRSRDTWLLMGSAHGLSGRTDVRAIAVDRNAGRRTVYAGTKAGLVLLEIPRTAQ